MLVVSDQLALLGLARIRAGQLLSSPTPSAGDLSSSGVQVALQRMSTLSRVDPAKKTLFDSFATIVQELPSGRAQPLGGAASYNAMGGFSDGFGSGFSRPGENPFFGRVDSNAYGARPMAIDQIQSQQQQQQLGSHGATRLMREFDSIEMIGQGSWPSSSSLCW